MKKANIVFYNNGSFDGMVTDDAPIPPSSVCYILTEEELKNKLSREKIYEIYSELVRKDPDNFNLDFSSFRKGYEANLL